MKSTTVIVSAGIMLVVLGAIFGLPASPVNSPAPQAAALASSPVPERSGSASSVAPSMALEKSGDSLTKDTPSAMGHPSGLRPIPFGNPLPETHSRTRSTFGHRSHRATRFPNGCDSAVPASAAHVAPAASSARIATHPIQAKPISIKTESLTSVTRAATPPVPQAAAWADLGTLVASSPEEQEYLQRLAEETVATINEPELPVDSPEYRRHWDESVAHSDFLFRQRYGAGKWMAHHIRAHHLANGHFTTTP